VSDTRGIRAGRAFVELGVSDKLTRGLRRAQQRLQAFGQGVRNIGTRLTTLGAGIVTPILAASRSFMQAGDALDKMAGRTGVSVTALQELGFAAEQSGANIETLESGLGRMNMTIHDAIRGSRQVQEALQSVGLSASALAAMSPDEAFMAIAEALSRVEDFNLRRNLAEIIFGKGGRGLLPMLSAGAEGIADLRQQWRQMEIGLSEADVSAAVKQADAWNILRHSMRQFALVVGAAVAPILTETIERVTVIARAMGRWINQNRSLVGGMLKVGAAVLGLGLAFVSAGTVLLGAAAALKFALAGVGIALAVLTSPIAALIASLVALGTTIVRTTEWGGQALQWLRDRFGELLASVSEVVGGIVDALMAGDLGLAMRVLWLSADVAFRTGTNVLLDIFDSFTAKIRSMWNELGMAIVNSDWWDNVRVALGMKRVHVRTPSAPERDTAAADARTQALAEAQRELADAIGQARRARRESAEVPGMPGLPRFQMPTMEDIRAITDRIAGTFNIAALQGLQGSPTEDRIARATEETARGVRQLNSRASAGGLVLTP
jgi:hypothetical protein